MPSWSSPPSKRRKEANGTNRGADPSFTGRARSTFPDFESRRESECLYWMHSPPKESVYVEIIAFAMSRRAAFPGHAYPTLLSARLFSSSPLCKQRFLLSADRREVHGPPPEASVSDVANLSQGPVVPAHNRTSRFLLFGGN